MLASPAGIEPAFFLIRSQVPYPLGDGDTLYHPNLFAVSILWQLAHITRHFSISASILDHGSFRLIIRETVFILSSCT